METDNQAVQSLVNHISHAAFEAFGKRCIAVYLMGSLARGGFSELTSDIDVGIILCEELENGDELKIHRIINESTREHASVHNKVSIFWGNVASINGDQDGGRYPPFDRLDLIEHALLIEGVEIRDQLIRPSQASLEIEGAKFAIDYLGNEERMAEFFDCQRIVEKGSVYVTKTVLFPARFIYLHRTNNIAGNDVSYQYFIEHFSGDACNLLAMAYQWRLGSVPESMALMVEQLQKGLVPLYLTFIDIYIDVMGGHYGEESLVLKLKEWKSILQNEVT